MRMVLAVVLVCACAGAVAASVVPTVPIEVRARGAERVVLARVTNVQSRFEVNEFGDRLIVSDVTLSVEETLKGPWASWLRLTVEGGTVGDVTLRVSDVPSLRANERAVMFLESASATGGFRLHRRGLGVLPLDARDTVPGTTLTLPEIRRLVQSARP